jgi:hypothetical protein
MSESSNELQLYKKLGCFFIDGGVKSSPAVVPKLQENKNKNEIYDLFLNTYVHYYLNRVGLLFSFYF